MYLKMSFLQSDTSGELHYPKRSHSLVVLKPSGTVVKRD